MSWAEEDWTVGLSGRALQKVKELQVQQERLNRERQQKQLQLDSTQTALNKQTVKYEEVRGELQGVQRELQGTREEAQAGVCARERLSQDLQVKQAQVCSLEGQLDSARTLTHTLTQEVKRLEAELEKLQNSNSSGDSMLFSTPCWSMTSPWDHNGGRQEDRQGHRGEGDNKALHVRQQLQFSESSPMPLGSGATSPMIPRQPPKSTPHRRPYHQSDSSTPSAVFPWERNDPKPAARGCPAPAPAPAPAPSPSSNDVVRRGQDTGDCGVVAEPRRETDIPGCAVELQDRVRVLQDELQAEADRFRQTQEQLANARRDLGTREHSLQKARDELGCAHTRISQESDRASAAELRLRQLQEELKCQRQNTETSRLHAQQRTKDLEKQHQRDLLELQKERQALEKQQQHDVNKLNQEIQQARTLHNALQAQCEKVSLQKQASEREVETLKEKLKWTEGELKESQKRESQTQIKLTEALRESEGLSVTVELSRRRVKGLEEEVKRLTQELAEALRLFKELQDQKTAPVGPITPVQFCAAGQNFATVSPPHHTQSAPPHTPTSQAKRSSRGEREREEEGEERGSAGQRAKYPTDREPGEGIDSEHVIPFGSSDMAMEGISERGASAIDKITLNTQSIKQTQKSNPAVSHANTKTDSEGEVQSARSKLPGQPCPEGAAATMDLQHENGELRSELRDVREELQRRLDDLESQRRAEAEARTRLKQLSRKHASQAERSREREEEEKERRKELEEERAETRRLKEALAALEREASREREKRERREKEAEKEREQEERESESIVVNIQLKKQLVEVKEQLSLEREEREREKEEERNGLINKGMEGSRDLTVKLSELEAELEELKNHRRLEEKTLMVEKNTPLTYLTLQHINSNSNNNTATDNELLPSPDQHRLLCESTNLQNTAVSMATAAIDLIQDERTVMTPTELSRCRGEGETIEEVQKGVSTSGLVETTAEAQRGVSATSDLAQEVERLQGESAREAGRARQCQAKLEALQSQVTSQTQQLTLAFDHQSRHIQDLLAELQDRETALLSQGGELQRCQEELVSLRAERERQGEESRQRERREEEIKRPMEEREGSGERATQEQKWQATVCLGQADTQSDTHQTTHSTDSETISVMEGSREITVKTESLNPPQASLASCDGQSQLTVPQECPVTQSHDTPAEGEMFISKPDLLNQIPDSSTSLAIVPVELDNTQQLVESETSAQLGSSDGNVGNTEEFQSEHLTKMDSTGQMELPDSSELKDSPSVDCTKDSLDLRRATEELLCLAKTENDRLAVELEKMTVLSNRLEDRDSRQIQDGGREDLAEELKSLKQENQQLKRRLEAVTVSGKETSSVSKPTLAASCEDHVHSPNQNRCLENELTPCSRAKETLLSAAVEVSDIVSSGQEMTLQDGEKPKDEGRGGGESEKESETGAGQETDSNTVTQPQITCLEKQMVALQDELLYLSEENQRQAEELVLWRLTAQTQTSSLGLEDPTDLTPGHKTVTVIREDELLLSCSSNRLYGRTLASRLQHCNSPEPKSPQHSPKKTSGSQECIQETPVVSMVLVQEKNVEDSFEPSRTKATLHQEMERQTNRIQGTSGVRSHQHSTNEDEEEDDDADDADVTKDVHLNSGLQTKATEHADKDGVEEKTKPNAPRATNKNTKTKAIEENLDIVGENDVQQSPTRHGVEAESTEVPSAELKPHSYHQEDPVSSVRGKPGHQSSTNSPSERQAEVRIVEGKGERSEVRRADGGTVPERVSCAEVRSAGTQTEEGKGHPATPAMAPELKHACTQTEEVEKEEEEELAESPPLSPVTVSEGDRLLFSGSFPIPADPARLAERIRRNRSQMSAAYDDTEYEPYGLPEVVMKGFADIPSVEACPYIIRRGLLGTASVPLPRRGTAQREAGQGQDEPD